MSFTPTRRHALFASLGLLAIHIAACRPDEKEQAIHGQSMPHIPKPEIIYFSVNLLSYLERPIFDVLLNGKFIGDSAGQLHRGNGGIITGIPVPLGPQTVTWRLDGPEGMPGNGDTTHSSNTPILNRPDKKFTYLGVHIYPDNTVELIPEKFWPEKTPRGLEINRQWEILHNQ
ncbi:hypothetical protein [Comamonas sp. GB3 AK4-5]|uniref:hypothetical protein n=1 Tax=Comamonas sp. GB3 AK4-5 TaxID=3231487 RepID=UPI00351E0910